MTPARQPQEGYYLITKNEWNTLYNMDQNDFVIDLLERVRSRTHTSPPAPEPKLCFGTYDGRWDVCIACSYNRLCIERQFLNNKDKADVVKAAREQVVEDIRTKLSKLKTAYPTGADFVWWLVIDVALNEVKESLRPHQAGVSE